MRTGIGTVLLVMVVLFATASIAGAHAVVFPRTMNADSYEKFVLRVPNEKESATTQVKVEIPEGFAVSRVKPMYGWNYEFERAEDGKTVKAITWSGGKILPGEFQEFEFNGKTAAEPGRYAFRAWQTYDDGETVEWTGPADAAKPASFVELKAAATTTDSHGAEKPAQTPAPAPEPAPESASASSPLTPLAAYGGLILGAAALVLALRRR